MRKPVIAVDGYSSTGKSSISKIIAEKLGLIHLDTGALYRGVTYFALQNCLDEDQKIDLQQLFSKLQDIHLEFREIEDELSLFLNNKNISSAIRSNEVSSNVSLIACQKEVRDFLLDMQREIAKKSGVILDGRDIGTVVFPNADYKFFLTASIEERTRRRFVELTSLGIKTNEEEVVRLFALSSAFFFVFAVVSLGLIFKHQLLVRFGIYVTSIAIGQLNFNYLFIFLVYWDIGIYK
jgi:cytidylate kinase